jgi:tungstate transport system substrate-binding protein
VKLRLSLICIFAAGTTLAAFSTSLRAQVTPRNRDVVLATTTSLQDTGLLDSLLPVFAQETGFRIHAIAVGSGQALKLGERGDADVIIAHSPGAEAAFVRAGFATRRRVVAWNYFALVGPRDDPAGIASAPSASDALRRIAASGRRFVSRGDSSGTHVRELTLWQRAGGRPAWPGYVETGQGMSATLLMADERHAYTLCDRATLGALQRRVDLVALRGEEPDLLNVYHVIEVAPAGHAGLNTEGARAFADWITSPRGQDLLAGFAPAGSPLFVAARGREPAP